MQKFESLSGIPREHVIFTHDGVTYDAKKEDIGLTEEAKSALGELIVKLQAELVSHATKVEEHHHSPVEALTDDVGQAVADAMISEGKGWKHRVDKFLRRFNAVTVEGPKTKKNQQRVEKIEKKVEKYSQDDCVFVNIQIPGDEKVVHAPLIIRPGKSFDDIFHSFKSRHRLHVPKNHN